MENIEKSVRVTRGMKRRAESEGAQSLRQPALKKRVVLGELSNPTNVLNVELGRVEKPKRGAKKTVKRAAKITLVAKGVEPIVEVDVKKDDPQMCAAYVSQIYEYLHNMEIEPKRRPLLDYIQRVQRDVTANMRGVLVDWLVEVAEEYKLVSDTLFLTVSYIDRYLSCNLLNRQRLQLLGVSSMLIASKYEEISPPHVEDFCYITDNTYTKQEVVKMEADILKTLNFEMGNPTVKTFLRRLARVDEDPQKTPNLTFEFLSYYLAELSLLDYSLLKYLPSLVASSVIFLTRYTISPRAHPWTPLLHKSSSYKQSDLKECVCILQDLQMKKRAESLVAIRDKYSQHKFKCVSQLSSQDIPDSYFEDSEE